MPSIQELRKSRQGQFEPKWRHFHPQSRVWVKNPFNEDIVFYVADEANEQWQYRMPANSTSELPGGAIATLGVKEVVDRMIGENSKDAIHIWVLATRAKYESQIIMKIKDPPQKAARKAGGEINLAVSDEAMADEEDSALETAPVSDEADEFSEVGDDPADPPKKLGNVEGEAAFPGANRSNRRGLDKVKGLAAASLPTKQDQIVELD